ncbi:hypothetical protein VTL71DRAFT_3329 [Oculimacula yallundae]|uniref:Xylanolytic transcriptional activator regulatory domain-containing protein n=1 Tax=Oculimacula yallundae TaxID=86028 RepID=A0ABR4C8S0_9HELO
MTDSYSPQDGEPRRKRRRLSQTAQSPAKANGPQELGHMRSNHSKGSSSFVGSGSGIHFVRTVQSAFARNYQRESQAIDDALVPGEDDRLQTESLPGLAGSIWSANEVTQLSDTSMSDFISFDDLTSWSRQYWENWHPPFPFLHAPSILGIFERMSLGGMKSISTVDAIIVRSVLSISTADRRQILPNHDKLVPSNLVFNTIDDTLSCLTPVLLQPSTLASLQALVAMQLFLVSMLRLNTASKIGGLITRMAFQLGLHRCPSRYKQFSASDGDMRRRLFWTIYSLERYLSQSLGLPLDIKDDDVDVCYFDRELHTDSLPPPSHASHPPDTRLLLLPAFLARHGYIKGLILELRHKSVLHRTSDQDEVAHVDAEISKWWNEAQDLLDPHYMENEELDEAVNGQRPASPLKDSHKLLLIVQKHESTILLNRPVITSAPNSSMFASAMQKCIGASKQIVSKVYQHLQTGMNEAGSRNGGIHNPLCWPGFTWCIWMSGLILVYAACEGHYSVQTSQRDVDRCIKILEILALRGSVWPGACASALRDLQKALASKSLTGPLEQCRVSLAPNTRNARSSEAPSRSLNTSQKNDIRELATGSQSPSTARGNESVLSSLNETRLESSYQPSHFAGSPNDQAAQRPTAIVSQPEAIQAGLLSDPTLFDMSGMFDMGGQFDDAGDIFQLMDASYQLGEQMFEPSLNGRY